ncbi:MAG: amidohydrolase family protein [Propionivibrio sp.]
MRYLALFLVTGCAAFAQTMTVEEYTPRSTLVVPETKVTRAKFPFVDVHGHQRNNMSSDEVDRLVKEMDAMNMRVMVQLSGGYGERLREGLRNLKVRYPDRFVLFANLDFSGMDDPDWTKRTVAQLDADVKAGAQGLKIFKNLGLTTQDKNGRVHTDDPRLDPVWAKAGELGIPVLIHTGEPKSFFDPIDKYNERWLELKTHPNRARPADRYPSWEVIMAEQHNVFQKHPKTQFIAAHLDWLGNDLAELGRLMDKYPNMNVDIAAVIYDFGRQPRFAKQFLDRYGDRVLFGKDTYNPTEFPTYFRVLETNDEYFDYYRRYHAFWQMYGMGLSDEVLRKIYYKNACRLIPGLEEKQFEK